MAKTIFTPSSSSRTGAPTAHAAADTGWNVALFARGVDKLGSLAEEIGAQEAPARVDSREVRLLPNG